MTLSQVGNFTSFHEQCVLRCRSKQTNISASWGAAGTHIPHVSYAANSSTALKSASLPCVWCPKEVELVTIVTSSWWTRQDLTLYDGFQKQRRVIVMVLIYKIIHGKYIYKYDLHFLDSLSVHLSYQQKISWFWCCLNFAKCLAVYQLPPAFTVV